MSMTARRSPSIIGSFDGQELTDSEDVCAWAGGCESGCKSAAACCASKLGLLRPPECSDWISRKEDKRDRQSQGWHPSHFDLLVLPDPDRIVSTKNAMVPNR